MNLIKIKNLVFQFIILIINNSRIHKKFNKLLNNKINKI
jgi:hypothetical protein